MPETSVKTFKAMLQYMPRDYSLYLLLTCLVLLPAVSQASYRSPRGPGHSPGAGRLSPGAGGLFPGQGTGSRVSGAESAYRGKRNKLLNALLQTSNDEDQECLWQAQSCNPWKDECCPGMECLNYIRGYCMFGAEPCICFPVVQQDVLNG